MNKVVIYIHGKGGSIKEAEHYKSLFKDSDVIGFDYKAESPWEAKEEFPKLFNSICRNYKSVDIIANSIGAFFAMNALSDKPIKKAYFISPVVNMEKLIEGMMTCTNVTEEELYKNGEIEISIGETLSWQYLCYVRENPIHWRIPTHILYGKNDNLTSFHTISEFANQIGATLTVMENGEHWFHTDEQLNFLDSWIESFD